MLDKKCNRPGILIKAIFEWFPDQGSTTNNLVKHIWGFISRIEECPTITPHHSYTFFGEFS